MANNDNFGPGDDEFDRFAREVGDGLKDIVGRFIAGQGGQVAWNKFADAASRSTRKPTAPTGPAPTEPVVNADATTGVWAVLSVDEGGARVEQVFPTELEALRAHQHNTDASRRVRFLPYGFAVNALGGDRSATQQD